MSPVRIVALISALIVAASPAVADVISFGTSDVDHLDTAGTQTEGAYKYTAAGAAWELHQDILGSTALFTGFNDDVTAVGDKVDIVRVDSGAFSFQSIDWRPLADPADDVLIEGFLGGSLVGSLSIDVDNVTGWQTAIGFGGTIDLLRITVSGVSSNSALVLDNVVLSAAPASVPEPSGLILVGLALGAMTLVGRRRGG